jgi:hypothetical protein
MMIKLFSKKRPYGGGESATEWMLKLNRLGVFLHAHVERPGTQLRTQKADSCDPVAAILGADGSASGCKPVGAPRVRDSLGTWRDRRVAALSYFDFTISGAIH